MFSHLRLFLLPLVQLLLVALLEKGIFALYYADQFDGLTPGLQLYAILWGFRFDLAVAAAFTLFAFLAAYLLHRLLGGKLPTILRSTSYLALVALVLLQGGDLLYYGEAGRHLGYELKETLNSGSALAASALSTFAVPVALQLLLLPPLYLLNRWLFGLVAQRNAGPKPLFSAPRSRFTSELSLLTVLLLSPIAIRGGVTSVPLEPLHAQEIGDSRSATLALNGAYNALFSSITPYSVTPVFAGEPDEKTLSLVREMYAHDVAKPDTAPPPITPNVVMVLLESWSAPYMKSYGYDRDTTPFFDALRERAFTTRGMLAGGHRTTEGMFATFCSWQNPLGQTVAQSQLQNYDYDCLPNLMEDSGYHTAFFQGTLKNTSGTGAFAQLLGFNDSYGKEDVATHHYPYNSWGLHDPDLYTFILDKLATMPQPFFVGINSNSTHASELPPGVAPQFTGDSPHLNYLNTLHFADAALGDFIHTMEANPAFANTIFVLVADHEGPSPGEALQKYEIPFLIYAPGQLAPQYRDLIASQRDIAPTLLALLHRPAHANFTGQSLLDPDSGGHADYFHQGILGWIEGGRGVELRLGRREQLRCFEFAGEGLAHNDLPCDEEDDARRDRALAFSHLSQSLLFSGKTKSFSQLRQTP